MKTYSISKEEIIKAVIEEPLTVGTFFRSDERNDDGKCSVCAVGAVLRRVKPKAFGTDSANNITEWNGSFLYIDDAEKSNNFLAILSSHHEYFYHHFNRNLFAHNDIIDHDLQILHLLSVIEAFCPETVTFKI